MRNSHIYREKVSGAEVGRKELSKLVKSIAPGDQVVAPRIGFAAVLQTTTKPIF